MTLFVSRRNPDCDNIEITTVELKQIRQLSNFDLMMFLSGLEDFGWQRNIPRDPAGKLGARELLRIIVEANNRRNQ